MKRLTNIVFKNAKRKDGNKKNGILSGLAFIIVFFSLAITMAVISYTITTKLAEFNQTYTFINILLLMNFFILFTKSVFESLNVLYFSKDLKILLRMPIKSKDIVHAKLLNMIVSEYEMEIIMLAIPMIVYGILTKAQLLFYIYMVAILLILPVIPILLTSLIVSVIMRFTNKIKNKSKVIYIVLILASLFLGLAMTGLSNQNTISENQFTEMVLQANGIAETISDYFILIKPIMNTMLEYNNINGLKNFIIYVFESVVCYIVVLWFISKIYLKGAIGSTINSKKNSKNKLENISLNDFKKSGIKKAYLIKELKTIIRTPIFFIQCLIIPIIYPLAVIVLLFILVNFANNFTNIWESLSQQTVEPLGYVIFLIVGQVFYMMNFSSIIAISRDSKNSIIYKYMPIELNKQFKYKITLGTFTNLIAGILISVFYYLCTHNLIWTIFIFIELLLLNIIGEKFKLLIDLNRPQINWNSEYTMMKQNTNVMYVLFYSLIVIGLLLSLSRIVNNILVACLVISLILFVINMILTFYINKNERKLFKKIY